MRQLTLKYLRVGPVEINGENNLLPDSVNTMRCSFYSNINCLKSVIDTLQQRCHMTLLVSLLLQTSKLLYGVFSTSNVFTILRKIAVNLQAKSFRRICENVKSLRKLYQQSTSSQVVFKLSTKIFNNFEQVIRHTYLPTTYLRKPICIILVIRNESLETPAVLLVFSLELEIFGVTVPGIHQTAKNRGFCEELLCENNFEAVLATFCVYECGTKASHPVQKIATDQKFYHKCSLCVIVYQDISVEVKNAAEIAQKKSNNWTMVSFIYNGSEITTWTGYSFKTKSTKSNAKQHF